MTTRKSVKKPTNRSVGIPHDAYDAIKTYASEEGVSISKYITDKISKVDPPQQHISPEFIYALNKMINPTWRSWIPYLDELAKKSTPITLDESYKHAIRYRMIHLDSWEVLVQAWCYFYSVRYLDKTIEINKKQSVRPSKIIQIYTILASEGMPEDKIHENMRRIVHG